jgi:uncharacterized protein YjbJ (UPF0337 family)
MNQKIFAGKWNEFKGQVRNQWGKLTDNDLEGAKGNLDSIAGLIQEHYGEGKSAASQKLNTIADKFLAFDKDAFDTDKGSTTVTGDMKGVNVAEDTNLSKQ